MYLPVNIDIEINLKHFYFSTIINYFIFYQLYILYSYYSIVFPVVKLYFLDINIYYNIPIYGAIHYK